jgi:NADH-ubiquinone oxidoreductase chain 2
MQYSISNLNAFILLISIGYTFYTYINNNKENDNLLDKNNSPVQLISQIKGYFSINPVLAISFCITIYSFVGIPPLVGFFAKQMVLSAALDNGYIFITFVAILTSVISAVYYLSLIKQMFFDKSDYKLNPALDIFYGNVVRDTNIKNKTVFNASNIVLSGNLSIVISILTLVILLFILNPQE